MSCNNGVAPLMVSFTGTTAVECCVHIDMAPFVSMDRFDSIGPSLIDTTVTSPEPDPAFQTSFYDFFFPSLDGISTEYPDNGITPAEQSGGTSKTTSGGDRTNKQTGTGSSTPTGDNGFNTEPGDTPGTNGGGTPSTGLYVDVIGPGGIGGFGVP